VPPKVTECTFVSVNLIVFFGHYRGQEDMAEAVNGLAGKVIRSKVKLESASEILNAGG
jgi:hypothetical protein